MSPSFPGVLSSCHHCRGAAAAQIQPEAKNQAGRSCWLRRESSRSHKDDKAAETPGLTRPCFARGLLCFSKAQRNQCLPHGKAAAWVEQTPLHCPAGTAGQTFCSVLVFTRISRCFLPGKTGISSSLRLAVQCHALKTYSGNKGQRLEGKTKIYSLSPQQDLL